MAWVLVLGRDGDQELNKDTHSLHWQLSPICMCGWYRTNQALFDLSSILGDFTRPNSCAVILSLEVALNGCLMKMLIESTWGGI